MSIKGFEVGGVQAKYDYESLDNIPANLVQDANYVHTDNNYTNADKTKLSGIEAQANKTTIDATLTHSGQAADAKATGDAISALNAQVIASMPHDTASGSIASFPDGAAMPIRDLSVDIEPVQDLNGYDNPWPAGGGVNLLPSGGAFDTTKNGIRFVSDGKGTYTITGTATADAYYEFSIAEINIPSTAYIHMLNNVSTYSIAFVFFNGNTQITAPTPVPVNAVKDVSATLGGQTVNKLRLFVSNGYTANLTFSPMLCVDNTVKPFSPYSNICPISGWTEAKVTRTGKNLNPYEGVDFTASTHPDGFWLNAGDYVFSLDTGGSFGSGNSIYIKLKDRDGNVITDGNISGAGWTVNSTRQYYYGFGDARTSAPFTLLTDCFFCFGFNNTKPTANGVQLELGSTATAYESYQGQTYTIDLDGTRYGGTLDVTSGKLTVDRAMVDLGTLSWTKRNTSSGHFRFTTNVSDIYTPLSTTAIPNLFCSAYPVITPADSWVGGFGASCNTAAQQILISDESYTDAAAFKTAMSGVQLVYELAAPIEVDLDPVTIETLLGTNNIFADCGDTTVDYYADTTLFVNKKIAAAVAALS